MNEERNMFDSELESTVWVCFSEKSAAFHPVSGYEQISFSNKEFFISYLENLQKQGFRFQ